jgi:predicted metal-binding protein
MRLQNHFLQSQKSDVSDQRSVKTKTYKSSFFSNFYRSDFLQLHHTMVLKGKAMDLKTKIGIIICDRYRRCAGGKCFRAIRNKEGAFSIYKDTEIELVGFTTCDGCPGGNVEYAGEEMLRNGAEVIHLATGLVVGYPPCPHIETFKTFLERLYKIKVVVGTHPIPEKYLEMHNKLRTWEKSVWKPLITPSMSNKDIRISYN